MSVAGNILLIDDDLVNSKLHAKRLTRRGYTVETASDADSGIAIIHEKRPDVLLLDGMMPGKSGLEALEELRENYTRIELPIIMLTSMDSVQSIVKAFSLGANDYLTKPVHMDEAVARITTQLELKHLHEERVKHQRIEAISAMIVTYNHEINNPLMVAYGAIARMERSGNQDALPQLKKALERVTEINKKIRSVSTEHFETVEYASGRSMISLKGVGEEKEQDSASESKEEKQAS